MCKPRNAGIIMVLWYQKEGCPSVPRESVGRSVGRGRQDISTTNDDDDNDDGRRNAIVSSLRDFPTTNPAQSTAFPKKRLRI